MNRKIDRFDKYMEIKGLNDNKVTVKAGITVGTIGKSRKEGRDLSAKTVEQLLYSFPDINAAWLLTGEGEMLKSEDKTIDKLPNNDTVPMSILQFIMEEQKKSGARVDDLIRQNGVLVETVRSQAEIIKKTVVTQMPDVQLEEGVECAAASGSDLED